jgi:glycosyltransferase involved in cell wall biosynthesis
LLCAAFRERPQLRLRIAGDGPLAEVMRGRYADCTNVEFLGKLPAAALKQEMRQARFSVVPSEWYENNPMSVLESFGAGTPVLGANIGGIPELVLHGSTGLIFSPSDKASLLQSLDEASSLPGEARAAMGRKALQLISQRHSETAYYARLLGGYSDVIRARQGTI